MNGVSRIVRRRSRADGSVMYDAICAECGRPTKVPFEPKTDKPIYCSDCFARRRG